MPAGALCTQALERETGNGGRSAPAFGTSLLVKLVAALLLMVAAETAAAGQSSDPVSGSDAAVDAGPETTSDPGPVPGVASVGDPGAVAVADAGAVTEVAPDGGEAFPLVDASPGPTRVERIELRGLSWTKDFVALRELQLTVPGDVSGSHWSLGLTRLWNCGLFSRVDGRLERRPEGVVAVVELEERFALNPLFSFGIGGGAAWVRVGANDTNFLGRFLEWGLRYERFLAYNGGQLWVRDPRLFGQRVSGLLQGEWLFRPRPEYTRRRLQGIGDVLFELGDVALFGLRTEVFRDEYFAPLVGEGRLPTNMQGLVVHASLRFGRVDTVRLRERGVSLEVRSSFGVTSDPAAPSYVQSWVEALGFVMLGERFNLALRAQGGVTTRAPTEQRFYLGGLDLVRGYDDSTVRTDQFVLGNVELRGVVFDSTWFAVVPAVFVDGALVRREEDQTPRGLLSTGLGLRLLVPKLLRTGLRADLAFTLAGGRPQVGIAIGVFQFFSSTDRLAIK